MFSVGLDDVDNQCDVVAGINDRCTTGNTLGDAGMEVTDFAAEGAFPHYRWLLENRCTVRFNLMHCDSREDATGKSCGVFDNHTLGITVNLQRFLEVPQAGDSCPCINEAYFVWIFKYRSDTAPAVPQLSTGYRLRHTKQGTEAVEIMDAAA